MEQSDISAQLTDAISSIITRSNSLLNSIVTKDFTALLSLNEGDTITQNNIDALFRVVVEAAMLMMVMSAAQVTALDWQNKTTGL